MLVRILFLSYRPSSATGQAAGGIHAYPQAFIAICGAWMPLYSGMTADNPRIRPAFFAFFHEIVIKP